MDCCSNTYNPGQTDTNHDGCEDEQGGGTGGDIQLAELHIYGRSRLGMMKPEGVTMAPEENRVSHNVDVALEEHNSVYVRRVNRKQYELVDHLGNVRVVITDVKTTEVVQNDKPHGPYKATLLASTNYYPFGMLQPERHWSTEEYRYGYNGKEMDHEASGNGNQYDYGFRIYNPRIAKFLSVDPLSPDYPGWSPYAFAMNRVIDGVDLDGLEYLRADEAVVEARYGEVRLKVENLSAPYRSAIYQGNNDIYNWRSNEIGSRNTVLMTLSVTHTVATGVGGSLPIVLMDPSTYILCFDPSVGATDPAAIPSSYRLTNPSITKQSYQDSQIRRLQRQPTLPISGSNEFTQKVAVGVLSVNAAALSLTALQTWMINDDYTNVYKQLDVINLAIEDVQDALSIGIIPENYQTTEGMSNILNVVLQGENNSKDPKIYEIGMKIFNLISKPEFFKPPTGNQGGSTPQDNTSVNIRPVQVPINVTK